MTTGFNWDDSISFFSAAEKCNGASVCRQSVGRGVMCPSYKATRSESFSTRGRANLLRKALNSNDPLKSLGSKELKEALDLCLSCKACKTECPASVDMARLKSEYLYQTQTNQNQLELWYFKNIGKILEFGSKAPSLFNFIQNSFFIKKLIGLNRNPPALHNLTLSDWWKNNHNHLKDDYSTTVYVICDALSQHYDIESGKSLLSFLKACKVNIKLINQGHSIVALISKGLLDEAKNALIKTQDDLINISNKDYVVGIEPSEVLVWRDDARFLVKKQTEILLFDELLLKLKEIDLMPKLSELNAKVWVHTHCHQKALVDRNIVLKSLSLIPGIRVEILDAGCCGMAGDFGYKYTHLSETIANQSLGLAMKKIEKHDVLVSSGTSCRRQISDVFSEQPLHLTQLFFRALSK